MEEALSGSVGKRESKARLEREETSSLTLRDRIGHSHKRSHRKQLDSLQIRSHRATVLCNRYKYYNTSTCSCGLRSVQVRCGHQSHKMYTDYYPKCEYMYNSALLTVGVAGCHHQLLPHGLHAVSAHRPLRVRPRLAPHLRQPRTVSPVSRGRHEQGRRADCHVSSVRRCCGHDGTESSCVPCCAASASL